MFIYPLDWELYGEIQFSLSSAVLLSAFLSLGSHSLANKYFPYFKSTNTKGFLSLLFIYSTLNIILVSLLLYIFKTPFSTFLSIMGFNVAKIKENLFIIAPIGFLLVYISFLRSFTFNYGRIVYPDIISNFSLKFLVPTIIVLSHFSILTYSLAGWILVLFYFIIVFTLMIYLNTLNGLDLKYGVLKRISIKKHFEMLTYMLYGAMNQVGSILVYKIDIVMIGLLLNSTKVGYYSIFLFLSVVIEIPTKAVFQITAPLISKAFDESNLKEIHGIYKSSSINLYIVGIILFTVTWLNIETFFVLMTNGNDLVIYKSVFLLLAITKLIDMITSVNLSIISYSKYFKVNTLFIVVLAFLNILLNIFFINKYGIIGAAISTCLSMLMYNTLKTAFIIIKFKMHPFSKSIVIMTLFLSAVLFLPFLFPTIFKSILFSALISTLLILGFLIIIYKFKYSPEINKVLDKYLSKILH